MGGRHIRGSVPPDQVTRKLPPKQAAAEIDWPFLDELRAAAVNPKQLCDLYKELPASGKKKLHIHVVAMAYQFRDEQTRAFDIMSALLDGRFDLPKSMLKAVSSSVLSSPYADKQVQRAAERVLSDLNDSNRPERLFLPDRPGRPGSR